MARSRSILLAPLRLITLTSNPCRLCPELDRYTDAECLRFAADLQRVRTRGALVAFAVVFFVGGPATIAMQEVAVSLLPPRSVWTDTDVWPGRTLHLATGVVMLVFMVWIGFLPYCLMLRSAVRGIFRGLVCRKCSYNLTGLPILEGAIRCPECSRLFVLAEEGFPEVNPEKHRPEPRSLPKPPFSDLHMYFGHTWVGAFFVCVLIALILGPLWFLGGAVLVLVGSVISRWRKLEKGDL